MSLAAFMREQQYWEILRQATRLGEHDWPRSIAAKHSTLLASVQADLTTVASSLYQARRELLAAEDERERLREFVEGIAGGSCCESPGCSIDDPMCDTMMARAMLEGKEDT